MSGCSDIFLLYDRSYIFKKYESTVSYIIRRKSLDKASHINLLLFFLPNKIKVNTTFFREWIVLWNTNIKKINGMIRIVQAAHLKKDRDIDADKKIYIINIYKNTYNWKMTSRCCVQNAWFTLQAWDSCSVQANRCNSPIRRLGRLGQTVFSSSKCSML